jgi:hypothetical protein
MQYGKTRSMLRVALVILVLLALLWMIVPMIHEQATEMGFPAGSPDPNVYTTTYLFGSPLTWISWERSWNEAAGYDESEIASFNPLNLVAHLLVVAAPVLVTIRVLRTANRRPSDNGEGD